MRQFHGMPRSASAIGSDASAVVQHHDPRASRRRVAHGALGAALAAQEPGQPIPAGREQLGRARLHDLPDAGRALDGERVGAAEQRQVGDAFQRAGQQIDHQRIAEVEARGGARVEVRDQRPDPGAAAERGQQLEAIGRGAAEHRHLARPRNRVRGDQRPMRGLVLGQLRQVHQHRIRRAEHDGPRQRRRAGIAGRQVVGRAVLAHRLDAARLGVGDGDEPQIDQPPVMREPDRVGRIEREARGRQTERRRLAAHPRLHQRAAAAALGLLGRHRHREGLGGDPGRVHGDAPRLDEGGVVILVGAGDLPFQRLRQFGLLAARQFQHVALAGGHQIVGREGGDGRPAAHDEADHALGLHGVEAEVARQRGDRGARAFERRDGVALDRAPEAGDVDPGLGQPGAQAEVPDERRQRHRAEPSGQPVARAASSPRPSRRRSAPGRTDRAARPRSRRRIRAHAPSGRRRPRTPGCSRPRPTRDTSPRDRRAGSRRRASPARNAA